MRLVIPLLLAAAAAPCLAQAPTYKWVDERGVVTYGTKPPPGRPARPVDTTSRNRIDTAPVPTAPVTPVPGERPPAVLPPSAATPAVRGMEFDTYVRLQRGMSEGELLQRAGRPDYLSLDPLRDEVVKSFYYYPTRSDPFTTLVIVRGGRIDSIERTKKY